MRLPWKRESVGARPPSTMPVARSKVTGGRRHSTSQGSRPRSTWSPSRGTDSGDRRAVLHARLGPRRRSVRFLSLRSVYVGPPARVGPQTRRLHENVRRLTYSARANPCDYLGGDRDHNGPCHWNAGGSRCSRSQYPSMSRWCRRIRQRRIRTAVLDPTMIASEYHMDHSLRRSHPPSYAAPPALWTSTRIRSRPSRASRERQHIRMVVRIVFPFRRRLTFVSRCRGPPPVAVLPPTDIQRKERVR